MLYIICTGRIERIDGVLQCKRQVHSVVFVYLQSKGKPLRLQDMSEGYIGKLRVHKSGKVK